MQVKLIFFSEHPPGTTSAEVFSNSISYENQEKQDDELRAKVAALGVSKEKVKGPTATPEGGL